MSRFFFENLETRAFVLVLKTQNAFSYLCTPKMSPWGRAERFDRRLSLPI